MDETVALRMIHRASAPADPSRMRGQVPTRDGLLIQATADGRLAVIRQESFLAPDRGEVAIELVAASICAADLKVLRGEKDIPGGRRPYGVPGHEGFGHVRLLGDGVDPTWADRAVGILPHLFRPDHDRLCPNLPHEQRGPRCTGWPPRSPCTRHLGFLGSDSRGTFSSWISVPVTNVVPVGEMQLDLASTALPQLPRGALFTLVEPTLCAISAIQLASREHQRRFGEPMARGRALIIGAGAMGALLALVVARGGWQVVLADLQWPRVSLARSRLPEIEIEASTPYDDGSEVDLVIVSAPTREAVHVALERVREMGVVLLFAGIGRSERPDRRPALSWDPDLVHREARFVELQGLDGRPVRVIGGSGYFEELAPAAVQFVAEQASHLARLVTGVTRGLDAPVIESTCSELEDVRSDGPVLVEVLHGAVDIQPHLKVVVDLGSAA